MKESQTDKQMVYYADLETQGTQVGNWLVFVGNRTQSTSKPLGSKHQCVDAKR